ncbi:MAG: PD-(D/E)XK nuclease family protein [Deltaproteobacteria bacterium]|nr:PD-(D/E)XK nuclease family protein [Deltaproteobacteria bacterium]
MLNLFAALARPYDDLAWAGALRAPWLSISNQTLCSLGAGQGLWSRRILSGKDDSPDMRRFSEAVEEARKLFGREHYASTLQRLWEDLDGPAITALYAGAAGVSNVRAYLELLTQCDGLPGEEALAKLNRLLESAYTPPDPRGAFSKISMMTIHKAKGLEFDHVFAVDLSYDPLSGGKNEPPAYRLERLPGEEKQVLIAAMGDKRTGEENLAYYLLKDLDNQRRLAETRRLFYVVSTRAKESLVLSGCIRKPLEKFDVNGNHKNPLDWLLKVCLDGKFSLREFKFECNPEPPEVPGEVRKSYLPSLSPPPFEAEPLPYRIASPSRVEDETSLAVAPGAEEEDEYARARGIVIHRIFDTLVRGGDYPDMQATTVALSEEGIPDNDASALAEDVLKEAIRTWEFPEFQALRAAATSLRSEWPVEDYDGEENLRVGRIDLVIQKDSQWIIVDYKTGKPEGDTETWIKGQVNHYRSQLSAYAQMVARVMKVPEERVGWVILFTAIPKLVRQ